MPVEIKAVDGIDTLHIKGRPLESHEVVRQLGQGANGVVYLATNKILGRLEAVKVWHSTRVTDKRDKLAQGIAEARKLALANKDFAVEIYSLQDFEGVPVATMEYVDGLTLRDFHAKSPQNPKLGRLAFMYLEAIEATNAHDSVHGDPHLSNVLVYQKAQILLGHETKLKLCDFGTSVFASKGFSTKRHWKIVEESVLELTKDLKGAKHARWLYRGFRAQLSWFKPEEPSELTAIQMAQVRNSPLRDYLRSLQDVHYSPSID